MMTRFCLTTFFCLLLKAMLAQPSAPGPIIRPAAIPVCYDKTTMLIFPVAIRDADRGSGDIIIRTARKTSNVLKVKAVRNGFQPTNLSVLTEDGRLYSINILFQYNPSSLAWDMSPSGERKQGRVLFRDTVSEHSLYDLVEQVVKKEPVVRRPAYKAHKMKMNLGGIWYQDGLLFFKFNVQNKSDIPFNLHFTRFYVRDRSKSKRTSSMEKELVPRHVYFTTDSLINSRSKASVVAAFDQFTIADDKYLSVELYEKNGDRQMHCRIKGRHILAAGPLLKRNEDDRL